MTTVCGPKAKVATFEGGGDDMDLPLKRLSSLEMFKDLRFFGSEKKSCTHLGTNINPSYHLQR